jgi:hypothetical protein
MDASDQAALLVQFSSGAGKDQNENENEMKMESLL